MALNQCCECDRYFYEDARGGCLCSDCRKIEEEKQLQEIVEL